MTLTTDGGATLTVTGERAGSSVPVRPDPTSPPSCTRHRCACGADGVAGYGIYEHLVTEFD